MLRRTGGRLFDSNGKGLPATEQTETFAPTAGTATGTGAPITGISIRTRRRDRGRGDSKMPGYWSDQYTANADDVEADGIPSELASQLFRMSARDLDLLKKQMYLAGYYGADALANGTVPQMGRATTEDVEAWQELIQNVAMYSANDPENAPSIEEMLDARIQGNQDLIATGALPGSGGYTGMEYLAPETVTLTDKAAIRQIATGQAKDLLGRELNPDEMEAVAAVVSSQEYAHEMSRAQQAQMVKRSAYAQRDAVQAQMRQNAMGTLPTEDTSFQDPVTLQGETTVKYGTALANKLGVQVMGNGTTETGEELVAIDGAGPPTKVKKYGTTMRFAGNSDRLQALAEWMHSRGIASEIEGAYGENGAESQVLTVTFNEGIEAPGIGPINGSPKNELDAFTTALRRPGGSEIYTWEGSGEGDPGTQRGAYGLSETTWRAYADKLGIDQNDHSIRSQDLIAKSYATDLYAKYNDWGLTGLALRYGEGVANGYKMQRGKKNQASYLKRFDAEIQDIGKKMADYSTADTAASVQALEQEGFAFGGQGGGTLVYGGGVNVEPGFSPEARSKEELERRNAPEAQAYGTLQAFDTFHALMGGGKLVGGGR